MLNILLVDDEASEREGIKFLIEKYGFSLRIFEASNGKNALAFIKEHAVDIVLTDIKMPFMDGLELAANVSKLKPAVKVIIFSAYGEFHYAKKAMEANAVSYLLKPIEVEEFVKVMTEVILACEEEMKAEELSRQLTMADKQMLLHRLFSGQTLEQSELDGLERHGIKLKGRYIQVLHLESKNSLFADHEDMFYNLLKMYAPASFEYVSMYPNEAGVILFSQAKIYREDIERFALKLTADVEKFAKEYLLVIAGNSVTELEQVYIEVNKMREMSQSVYGCDSGLLFTEDMTNFNEFYGKEILSYKNKVEQAIENRELSEVKMYVDSLILTISRSHSLSLVYMHYIFYDLLNKLYTVFGINDDKTFAIKVEELVKCRSYEDLKEAFTTIFSEIEIAGGKEEENKAGISSKVMKIIRNEYAKELNLDYIAEQVNVVPSYLSYLFKKETGDTLIKYITDFRMSKARELLEEGNLKIVQICKACGYENASYFNRLFKDYYGVTPKQYREKRQL